MIIAVLVFVALMGLDLVTTFIGLNYGAIESNPLWSVALMPFVKFMAVAITIFGWHYLSKDVQWRKVAHSYAWVVNIIMFAVVMNNAIVIGMVV